MNVDDGFDDIRWICGPGGERLPAASYALLPNLKKGIFFCHRRGIDNFRRLFSTYQRPNVFVSDVCRRPPRITGRVVNTVARGWVGARDERAPFRLHDISLVLSIGVCRRLRISQIRIKHLAEFFSSRYSPNILPGNIFFVFF